MLVSSSDVERTGLSDWSLAVCRTLLQIRKMFDALADALARRAQGPGGCSGQRSTHSESATVEFWPVRRFAAGSARRRRECRVERVKAPKGAKFDPQGFATAPMRSWVPLATK